MNPHPWLDEVLRQAGVRPELHGWKVACEEAELLTGESKTMKLAVTYMRALASISSLAEVRTTINGHKVTDGLDPMTIQMNRVARLNVFCMYAIHDNDFQGSTYSDLKEHLEIPKERLRQQFGKHAVVITDIPQFIDRVRTGG